MNLQLEIAILSAASALLGSIVGGVLSYLTTRHLKLQEWQQAQLQREITKREDLYSAFLSESSRLLFGTLDRSVDKATEFAELYTLTGKMQMLSTPEVVEAARELSSAAFQSYAKRGEQHTTEDESKKEETKKERTHIYQLRSRFTAVAREEIDQLSRKA